MGRVVLLSWKIHFCYLFFAHVKLNTSKLDLITTFCSLRKLGALERDLVVENGEGWRLLSCIWLHAGVVHLLANMISLLFIGIRLEQEFGFSKNLRFKNISFHSVLTWTILLIVLNCLHFGSQNRTPLCTFWISWKLIIYNSSETIYKANYISWCIWGTVWIVGSHAFWAFNKLDNLYQ